MSLPVALGSLMGRGRFSPVLPRPADGHDTDATALEESSFFLSPRLLSREKEKKKKKKEKGETTQAPGKKERPTSLLEEREQEER